MRWILLLATAFALPANAQVVQQVQTTTVSPALEVQRLAPQLIGFAGSDLNFANLVNGLALGVPVTLTTPLATGGMQVFTFTPAGTMTAVQIAQLLETARQSLIARGIAAPTAQQIGTTLTGGALTTALGATPVNALVNTQSPAAAIQGASSPAATATTSAAGGSTVRNISDSPLPRGISDTPPAPGVTAPLQATTADAAKPPLTPAAPIAPVAPVAPALAAPPVRTGDR